MKATEKALSLRLSGLLRHEEPTNAFKKRVRPAFQVYKTLCPIMKSEEVVQEARRQFIVSLCAGYEVFWRELVRVNVDSHSLQEKQLVRLKSHVFTFQDMYAVLGNKLTLGELVSSAYVFQGTDVLVRFCREFLDCDLKKELADLTVQPIIVDNKRKMSVWSKKQVPGEQLLKNMEIVDRCFAIRHESVHNFGFQYTVKDGELEYMYCTLEHFCIFVGKLVELLFDQKCTA